MDVTGILDDIQSYFLASGWFERVNMQEPKNAPGNGVSASIWAQDIRPIRSSGLASTSIRVEFWVRIATNMLTEPQNVIDRNLLMAVDNIFETLSGDFNLGGDVRQIDLMGEFGTPLSARFGYMNQDGKIFRTAVIVLPIIVNDNWTQVA